MAKKKNVTITMSDGKKVQTQVDWQTAEDVRHFLNTPQKYEELRSGIVLNKDHIMYIEFE